MPKPSEDEAFRILPGGGRARAQRRARDELAGGVARGSLPGRMQRHEEIDERRRLGGAQVLAIGRHVAASLDHLADELVLGESHRHIVESGTTPSPRVTERMAVATLLRLEDEGALTR